jgi:hypothetical protein
VSFLTANGIEIPVADGTPDFSIEEVGAMERGVNAALQDDRRAFKRVWKGTTPPISAAAFLAFRALVLGSGHKWDFEANGLFSSRGLQATTAGSVNASFAKYGTQSLTIPASSFVDFTGLATGDWTIWLWYYDPGITAWNWLSTDSSAATNSSTGTPSISISAVSGAVRVTNGSGTLPMYLDDVWILPAKYADRATWLTALAAFNAPKGACGRIALGGNFVEAGTSVIQVRGSSDTTKIVQGRPGGVFSPNLHQLTFKFQEI